jgi:site-specific recombinase XerD
MLLTRGQKNTAHPTIKNTDQRKKPVKSKGVNPEEKYRRDRAIIYLLTYAGLRVDECSHLKVTVRPRIEAYSGSRKKNESMNHSPF